MCIYFFNAPFLDGKQPGLHCRTMGVIAPDSSSSQNGKC